MMLSGVWTIILLNLFMFSGCSTSSVPVISRSVANEPETSAADHEEEESNNVSFISQEDLSQRLEQIRGPHTNAHAEIARCHEGLNTEEIEEGQFAEVCVNMAIFKIRLDNYENANLETQRQQLDRHYRTTSLSQDYLYSFRKSVLGCLYSNQTEEVVEGIASYLQMMYPNEAFLEIDWRQLSQCQRRKLSAARRAARQLLRISVRVMPVRNARALNQVNRIFQRYFSVTPLYSMRARTYRHDGGEYTADDLCMFYAGNPDIMQRYQCDLNTGTSNLSSRFELTVNPEANALNLIQGLEDELRNRFADCSNCSVASRFSAYREIYQSSYQRLVDEIYADSSDEIKTAVKSFELQLNRHRFDETSRIQLNEFFGYRVLAEILGQQKANKLMYERGHGLLSSEQNQRIYRRQMSCYDNILIDNFQTVISVSDYVSRSLFNPSLRRIVYAWMQEGLPSIHDVRSALVQCKDRADDARMLAIRQNFRNRLSANDSELYRSIRVEQWKMIDLIFNIRNIDFFNQLEQNSQSAFQMSKEQFYAFMVRFTGTLSTLISEGFLFDTNQMRTSLLNFSQELEREIGNLRQLNASGQFRRSDFDAYFIGGRGSEFQIMDVIAKAYISKQLSLYINAGLSNLASTHTSYVRNFVYTTRRAGEISEEGQEHIQQFLAIIHRARQRSINVLRTSEFERQIDANENGTLLVRKTKQLLYKQLMDPEQTYSAEKREFKRLLGLRVAHEDAANGLVGIVGQQLALYYYRHASWLRRNLGDRMATRLSENSTLEAQTTEAFACALRYFSWRIMHPLFFGQGLIASRQSYGRRLDSFIQRLDFARDEDEDESSALRQSNSGFAGRCRESRH